MYNKLFGKIVDSSIWLETTPTRIVWLTFIAVMDEVGFVQFAAVGNVANRARVTLEEAQDAIACLEAPDAESGDPANEGRRIERVPGGWMVLNAEKHREMVTRAIIKDQTRERVRRHREKKRIGNAAVTPSDTDTEVQVQANVPLDRFEEFWAVYPRKVGKIATRREWDKLSPNAALVGEIVAKVQAQCASVEWLKEGGQFIPHPRTWLAQGRWMDEPIGLPQVSARTARTVAAAAAFVAAGTEGEK